jgi:predicted O-methyltransferase YrrM
VHPDNVLETGTYQADTTVKLARAVAANGHGMVTSVELDHDKVTAARARLIKAKLARHVRLLSGSYDKVNLRPEAGAYQVAFFDSHWERDLEFLAAQPFLAKGCVVVFHDCGPQHKHGEVRARVQRLEDRHLIKALYIPTPRGVVVGVVE